MEASPAASIPRLFRTRAAPSVESTALALVKIRPSGPSPGGGGARSRTVEGPTPEQRPGWACLPESPLGARCPPHTRAVTSSKLRTATTPDEPHKGHSHTTHPDSQRCSTDCASRRPNPLPGGLGGGGRQGVQALKPQAMGLTLIFTHWSTDSNHRSQTLEQYIAPHPRPDGGGRQLKASQPNEPEAAATDRPGQRQRVRETRYPRAKSPWSCDMRPRRRRRRRKTRLCERCGLDFRLLAVMPGFVVMRVAGRVSGSSRDRTCDRPSRNDR